MAQREAPLDLNAAASAKARRRRLYIVGLQLWDSLLITGAFVGLVVLWQVATMVFAIPSYILPSPLEIIDAIADDWLRLLQNALVTFGEAAAGFAISIVVGIPLGVLIIYSKWLERILYPLLVASQSVPKVALAPIFVVWFGFGLLPKVLIAFSIAFFAIVVNTVVGLSRTPLEMMHLMRSLGARPMQIFFRVRVPMAMPYIFAGIKISAAFSVVGAIVGEFIAASSGLGYLQLVADNNFQIPLLFGILVLLSVMGAALYYIVVLIEWIVLPPPLRSTDDGQGRGTL
jgi:NitT/TauT family transport system permease protein